MPYESNDLDRDEIVELFHGLCIVCLGNGAHVHEIVPRSVDPANALDPDNRVLLCPYCHHLIHENGAKNYIDFLKMRRSVVLAMLY